MAVAFKAWQRLLGSFLQAVLHCCDSVGHRAVSIRRYPELPNGATIQLEACEAKTKPRSPPEPGTPMPYALTYPYETQPQR